jgi:hypothetical protein
VAHHAAQPGSDGLQGAQGAGRGTHPLLRGLVDPESLRTRSPAQWDVLLRQAAETQVLGRLHALLAERGGLAGLPDKVSERLDAARVLVEQQHRLISWELVRLRRALAHLGVPLVLLKGAAYLEAGLPPARGRLFSDVDLLVPERDLGAVEQALRKQGWEVVELDAYDERYYRVWSHELPPLKHRDRHVVVDVHHNILPPTGRLHPDPARLLAAARPVPGSAFRVLAPADMALHTCSHLFQSGELHAAVRDLVDLDALLRHFGRSPGFWEVLLERGRELGLGRLLFYGLRHASRLLATPVPAAILAGAAAAAPPRLVLAAMDAVVTRAVVPPDPDARARGAAVARWLLFVRYHWLRMPPLLLARHVLHKALARRPPPA